MSTPEHLAVEEAGHALRVKKTKTFQLIASGQLTAVKLGRRTLITAESVRELLHGLPKVTPKTVPIVGSK